MTPTKTLLCSFAASAALIATAAMSAPSEGGRKFTTSLTGAAEVTAAGVPNQGDPDGRGTARITVNPGKSQVCYQLTVSGIEPATAAHIHRAPATTTGPVVVPLRAPTTGSSSGCATVSRDLAKAILKNPSAYYVNVHNTPYPNGALRGQLAK